MFQNTTKGDLRFIMENKIVSISSSGNALTPNNIITKTVSNYGANNDIVARTTLQVERLIGASTIAIDQKKKTQLGEIVASYRNRLLTMYESYDHLWKEIVRCDKEFSYTDQPLQLPQITNLEAKVENFLLDGKKALFEISKLFPLFFNHAKPGHNYDVHLNWAKKHFSKESIIVRVLEDNTTGDRWINNLCDMRNRVEHQKENEWIKIENIAFYPETKKMIGPIWSTDSFPESNLLHDMGAIINNTLLLSEDLVAGCISETLVLPNIICIGLIPPDQINSRNPMRWGTFTNRPFNAPGK